MSLSGASGSTRLLIIRYAKIIYYAERPHFFIGGGSRVISRRFRVKVVDLSTPAEKSRSILRVVGLFSLIVVLVTTIYGVTMSIILNIEIVGQTFVNVEFPPIHIFPIFYMKPVSWLSFAIVSLVYCTLELGKERVKTLSPFKKEAVRLAAFVIGFMALYEVFFNFTLWSGLIARDSILGRLNPDLIYNPFPNPDIPWSIVFATKMYLVTTIICFYAFYFLTRLDREAGATT